MHVCSQLFVHIRATYGTHHITYGHAVCYTYIAVSARMLHVFARIWLHRSRMLGWLEPYVHVFPMNTCRYWHLAGDTVCTYMHVLVCAHIFWIDTCIYVHIRTYGVPSTVSVSARIHWKYMHILLQSTQHTAPMKSYTCTYVQLRAYTYMYILHTACTHIILCMPYVARICTYNWEHMCT